MVKIEKQNLSLKLNFPLYDFFGNRLDSLGVPICSDRSVDASILPHGYINFSQGLGTSMGRFKPFFDFLFNQYVNLNYL
jgi:hypothetical protein